jgi:hypothetical protein
MAEQAADLVVRNLIQALDRLRDDIDRVELWTIALNNFQHPAPEYGPNNQYLLPGHKDESR